MRLVVCDKKTNKWAILITLALIIQISNRISVHLLPFLLRAQAVLRRHNYWFLAGKSRSHVAARLTRKYWVPNFRHFVTINPSPPFICHHLSLFATIRHYSHYSYYSYYSLFAIRDYSLFAVRYSQLFAIRYSGFPDTQFIALYVVIAAFNLLLHSVIFWALKIIERNLKTYLSGPKHNENFTKVFKNPLMKKMSAFLFTDL